MVGPHLASPYLPLLSRGGLFPALKPSLPQSQIFFFFRVIISIGFIHLLSILFGALRFTVFAQFKVSGI